jgi:hypothetical protein
LPGADGGAGGVAAGSFFRPGAGEQFQQAQSHTGVGHPDNLFGFIFFGESHPGQGVAADFHQQAANFLQKGLLFFGLGQGNMATSNQRQSSLCPSFPIIGVGNQLHSLEPFLP